MTDTDFFGAVAEIATEREGSKRDGALSARRNARLQSGGASFAIPAERRANIALACQFTPAELSALAARLRARAERPVLADQAPQRRDLWMAAVLVEEVMRLYTDTRESGAVTDGIRRMLGLVGA